MPVFVRRQLQAEFGAKILSESCIRKPFDRFCETGTAEDRERSKRRPEITKEKMDEVQDFLQDELQSSVRTVVTACSISRTTAHLIMIERFSLYLS